MASAKWILMDWLFAFPLGIVGFFNNLNNFGSLLIAMCTIAYLCVRLYFYTVQKKQAVEEKEIELWHKREEVRKIIEGRDKKTA